MYTSIKWSWQCISKNDTNPIVINIENNQNQELDTPNNPEVCIPIVLDTNIIHCGEELLYFMKHDSKYHPSNPYAEKMYLNKMSHEDMYSRVYGDSNCAIYACLITIKPLAYEAVKFEKPKTIELIFL